MCSFPWATYVFFRGGSWESFGTIIAKFRAATPTNWGWPVGSSLFAIGEGSSSVIQRLCGEEAGQGLC